MKKMKNTIFRGEILSATVVVLILALLRRPSPLLMPTSTDMMLALLLLISFMTFIALLWKERPQDEREASHITNAGRFSFFVGTITLTLGIFIQSLSHDIDPWLIYTLALMIIGKITSRVYNRIRN